MTATRPILRTTGAFALIALVAGGLHAAREIEPRTWVLEFQAGPPSSALEKLFAIVQSAAIEGFGFLLVGLFLALAALGLARLLPQLRNDAEGSGYGGALVLCGGAFFGWAGLAWLADDALAFLTRGQVLALDVVAILAFLGGLVFYDVLARRCPWSPRASEANALGSVGGAVLGTKLCLWIVQGSGGGSRTIPVLLAG